MSYKIFSITPFDKQLKRLVKKYPSLKTEVSQLIDQLTMQPSKGVALGNDCYKIRLSIASKGKRKSGGGRVITYLAVTENAVFLLSVYDKSDQSAIDDKKLLRLISLAK